MDTLLYVGQIVLGAALLTVGLRWSATSRARLGMSSTSVTTYDDEDVTGRNCLFGIAIAAAAIVLGVTGLAGLPVLPAPVGVLVTGLGLISVLLAVDTTPLSYRVAQDAVSVIPAPRASTEAIAIPTRAGTEVIAIPTRAGPETVPGSSRRAA